MDAGLDPLEDQQLAGLVMWVPAGVVLALSALALSAARLGEAGPRVAPRLTFMRDARDRGLR